MHKKTGFTPSYTQQHENTATYKDPDTTPIHIPLLLPNISKYIDTIVLLERQEGKETAYTAQLKDTLARYNGYFFAKSIMDFVTGNVIDAIGAKGDVIGNPDFKKLKDFLDLINNRKKEIMKQIKEQIKDQLTYTELTEMFEKIDKNIRTNSIKEY